MSNAETSNLEQLVSRHVLTRDSQQQLSGPDIQTASARIRNERIKLENSLSQLLCSDEKDMVIERKIRHNHIKLVQLSNSVFQTITQARETKHDHQLASLALKEINELMQAAELLAANYIDRTIPLSHFLVNQWSSELLLGYLDLGKKLAEKRVNTALLKSLETFFQNLHHPQREVNEAEFLYAEKLLRGIGKLVSNDPEQHWEDGLLGLMVYFNFNKKEVMVHFSNKIKKIAMMPEPFLLIQEKLLTYSKDIRQMEENASFAYVKDRPSLKSYAIELIEEELVCLQQHRTHLLREIANSDQAYFIVDLTVRKLNLWAQINVEMGAIPYHTTPHVVKVMSQYIRTLKPGPISYESARRKLDDFDPTTVKGLHQWLTRQIIHLEKKYGEQLYHEKP